MTETNHPAGLAANVRAEASRRGISSLQIAAHLDLSQPAVSRRMWGHVEFSATELHKLAELLGVSLEALHGEVSA